MKRLNVDGEIYDANNDENQEKVDEKGGNSDDYEKAWLSWALILRPTHCPF